MIKTTRESIANIREECTYFQSIAKPIIQQYPGTNGSEPKKLLDSISRLQNSLSNIEDFKVSGSNIERINGILQEFREEITFAQTHTTTIPLEKIPVITDKLIEEMAILSNSLRDPFQEPAVAALKIINESRQKVLDIIKDVEQKKNEIYEIFKNEKKMGELLSGEVLKNDYQTRADLEKKEADKWTNWTWVFAGSTLVMLFIILLWQLLSSKEIDDIKNLQFISTKILITITLGLISKWSSKRANRHLMEESK